MLRYVILLIFFVGIASCKKEKDKIDLDVTGSWELESASGMLGTTTYPPGNGNLLLLESNGRLERRKPSEMPEIGNYTLSKGSECRPEEPDAIVLTFQLPGYEPAENFVRIEADKLHLNSEVCVSDGGYLIYRRI